MTLGQALELIDARKPNTFSRAEKIGWLSDLDTRIFENIFPFYEEPLPAFEGYDEHTSPETVLLAAVPSDRIYLFWLEAQIDYWLGDTARYNNSIATFEAEFAAFTRRFHLTHTHKRAPEKWF